MMFDITGLLAVVGKLISKLITETEAKARAVLMAADLVQGGLDAPHD
jgi:hypothetical protein